MRATIWSSLSSEVKTTALTLAFSAFCDIGDAIISEAPTFSGTLNTIRRHGPQVLDAPVDSEGMVTSVVRERLAAEAAEAAEPAFDAE